MGNLSQSFKCMYTITLLLFMLFLLSYTASSSSSSSHSSTQEIQVQPQNHNQNPSSSTTTPTPYYQVFYLKNTDSISLSRQERLKKRRMTKRNKSMMKHRKKILQQSRDSRPFSVMLPKGFVPPSGSSPCHNDQPNSLSSFHCHLSTTAAEP